MLEITAVNVKCGDAVCEAKTAAKTSLKNDSEHLLL